MWTVSLSRSRQIKRRIQIMVLVQCRKVGDKSRTDVEFYMSQKIQNRLNMMGEIPSELLVNIMSQHGFLMFPKSDQAKLVFSHHRTHRSLFFSQAIGGSHHIVIIVIPKTPRADAAFRRGSLKVVFCSGSRISSNVAWGLNMEFWEVLSTWRKWMIETNKFLLVKKR